MKGNVYIVKTTENYRKAEVGLSHPKHNILVMMKACQKKVKRTLPLPKYINDAYNLLQHWGHVERVR